MLSEDQHHISFSQVQKALNLTTKFRDRIDHLAGIYIHIPFCKQACHYCDFHFSTSLANKEPMLDAIIKELRLRKNYLSNQPVETIYLGGGTPSMMDYDGLRKLMDTLSENFEVDKNPEITIEANPDDLTLQKITELQRAGFNRLSIGIQSFRDQDLKMMNRAHTSQQADYAVKASQDKGFENITIDLIYSIPGMDSDGWKQNLDTALQLNIQHLSAYSLTIEPRTVFGHREKTKKLIAVDQSISEEQFLYMVDTMKVHGFEHYEVSNFGLPGFHSRHNTSYWKGSHYLGLGPSAHSFDGESRQWNISNNTQYIAGANSGKLHFEKETLDKRSKLNEYIMTGLRTSRGIDLKYITQEFGFDFANEYDEKIHQLENEGKLIAENGVIRLSTTGLLFADGIASDFFITQ